MSVFRYRLDGAWYKGNTHLHTTLSDGGTTPEDAARMYAEAGYDFLVRTDHRLASDVDAEGAEWPLLWLNGIELDGSDGHSSFHVVCIGGFQQITHEMGLVAAMQAARDQGGLLILAHPYWSGNSIDDALRHDFDGVEVYNHVCRWLNGKGAGGVFWDAMLGRCPSTVGLAVDDAHISAAHPGWDGGWIMVNAAACTREAITDAIRTGNFYSSCGPEFHSIEVAEGAVAIRTSPVQFVRLVGPASRGARMGSFEGKLVTEAQLEFAGDWPHMRIEIEDERGRRAWTNPLFVPGEE